MPERDNGTSTVSETVMQIMAWCTRFRQVADDQIARRLNSMFPALVAEVVDDPTEALKRAAGRPVVLLVSDPAIALAWHLSAVPDPEHALQDWRDEMTGILNQLRHGRRKYAPLDCRVLQNPRPAELALLGQRLGCDLNALGAEDEDEGVLTSDIDLVLASVLIDRTAELSTLAEAVRAATIGGDRMAGDQASALRACRAIRTLQDDAALLADLRQREVDLAAAERERALLRDALDQSVATHEAAAKVHFALETERRAAQKEVVDRQMIAAQNEALGRQLANARHAQARREALLGAQLLSDAEALRAVSAQASAAEARVELLSYELEKVYQSWSWRVTRLFRAARGAFRPNPPTG